MSRKKRTRYAGLDEDRLQRKIEESELPLCEIEKIIDVTSNSIYETKTIISGPMKEVEVYPVYLKKDIPEELRTKTTKEAQRNLNNKNAQKNFIRKVNTNFGERDYYITLVYEEDNLPKSIEEAKKNIIRYMQKLNYRYRKLQERRGVVRKFKTLKYIHVIEFSETGRIHHHIIMESALSMEVIEETWEHGRRNNIRRLAPDENHLTGIATYLSKDPKGKKRWGCSKNLKNPLITTCISKFSRKKINNMSDCYSTIEYEMEKVNPGYKFIKAETYKNSHTGKPYIYVTMRKID